MLAYTRTPLGRVASTTGVSANTHTHTHTLTHTPLGRVASTAGVSAHIHTHSLTHLLAGWPALLGCQLEGIAQGLWHYPSWHEAPERDVSVCKCA